MKKSAYFTLTYNGNQGENQYESHKIDIDI